MDPEIEYKESIKKHMPNWQNIPNDKIVLTRMTGITNCTYKAQVPNSQLQPIIFRKFGESNQNVFLERQSEIFVYLHISQLGIGPKIYYYDEHIRLEEFIESKVFSPQDMLTLGSLQEVAFTLRKFHQLKPNSQKIKKESLIQRIFIKGSDQILGICQAKLAKDIYTQSEKQSVNFLKNWVTKQEISFLEQLTKSHEEDGLVFSHNDLLANNILIENHTKKIIFIDYEYACYNYPIFDIANYLSQSQFNFDYPEYPFFSVNYLKPDDFPKLVRFIQAYVVAQDLTLEQFHEKFQTLRQNQKIKEKVNKLVKNLPFGMMLSQLSWGWWSIIGSKNPNINFDYIAFARCRYQLYLKYKNQLSK